MRRLTSLPSPGALNRLSHLQQRRQAAANGGNPLTKAEARGYADDVVKESLIAETSSKCAYCESFVFHVAWGDVEHILAKAAACHPELAFDYGNLTIACSRCNNAKGDYCDPSLPLVNPYVDDPEEHFVWVGSMTLPRNGSPRGELTRYRLKLDRKGLAERRQERIEQVMVLAQRYLNEPSGPRKEALFEQLQLEVDKDREYTAHVAAAIRMMGVPM